MFFFQDMHCCKSSDKPIQTPITRYVLYLWGTICVLNLSLTTKEKPCFPRKKKFWSLNKMQTWLTMSVQHLSRTLLHKPALMSRAQWLHGADINIYLQSSSVSLYRDLTVELCWSSGVAEGTYIYLLYSLHRRKQTVRDILPTFCSLTDKDYAVNGETCPHSTLEKRAEVFHLGKHSLLLPVSLSWSGWRHASLWLNPFIDFFKEPARNIRL